MKCHDITANIQTSHDVECVINETVEIRTDLHTEYNISANLCVAAPSIDALPLGLCWVIDFEGVQLDDADDRLLIGKCLARCRVKDAAGNSVDDRAANNVYAPCDTLPRPVYDEANRLLIGFSGEWLIESETF